MTNTSRLAKDQKTTDLFNQGFALYQDGRLKEAENYCRAVLAIAPRHSDALHLLGMTLHRQGDNLNAISFIKKAIASDPDKFFYHLNLGNIYFSQHNHAEAEICYQKALALDPAFVPTIVHTAQNMEKSERWQEAIDFYRKALTIEPHNPLALTGLGNALLAAGRLEESITTLRKLVRTAPNQAAYYYNLGGALMHSGDMEGAAEQFRKALHLHPDFVEAYYNLELTLENRQERHQPLPAAISFYSRVLASDANHPIALTGLAKALLAAGLSEEATATLRKLIKAAPDRPESYFSLGLALGKGRDLEGAMEQYKKAIALRPNYAEAHHNLGLTYEYLGRRNDAVNSYRRAIKSQPGFTPAHSQLATIEKHSSKNDDDIVAMENIFNSKGLPSKDRMMLAYGLGNAYEDLKLYDKAFDFIEEANSLKRSTYSYNIAEDKAYFEQLKEFFSQSLFKRLAGSGLTGKEVIFVLGMPRSGTSLVEQILASHPLIYGAGELDFLEKVAASTGISSDAIYLKNLAQTISKKSLQVMGRKYLAMAREIVPEKAGKYFVDKMPHNFEYIGLIKLMLPGAKVIHCQRQPLDNCLSIYKNIFAAPHKYAYNQTELGTYYQLYLQLMAHWQKVLPGFIHNIRYEDLIADQEKQSRALFEFCEIPWDNRCLSFHETDRTVTTISSSQVRRPIYTDSVDLWLKYGDRLRELNNSLKN